MNDPLGPPETRIVLLERLHDLHIQCAGLCTRMGRQSDARAHFDACREIVVALMEIDRQKTSDDLST